MSLATLIRNDTNPSKVHHSQYIRTENEPTEKPTAPESTPPEKPEAK